jgi:flagellar basal-body rod modification protein FlgD
MTISNTTAASTVTGYTTAAGATTDTVTNPKSTLGESDFLSLLITQLENQDPTDPVSDTDMIADESQFSSLDELSSMNTTMTTESSSLDSLNTNIEALISMENTTQAAGLIGKTVSLTDSTSGATVTGTVSGVNFVSGTPMIQVNGQEYGLSTVTSITA